MRQVRDAIADVLDDTTPSDACAKSATGDVLTYYI